MTGIIILFGIVFPLVLLIPVSKSDGKVYLPADQTSVYRGMAAVFVVISHITSILESAGDNPVFRVFDVLGGMGVLIFFFLSGYGMYKGHFGKRDYAEFAIKRLQRVVLPYIFLKSLFATAKMFLFAGYRQSRPFITTLDDWFIDVIVIQYVIFLITWMIAKNRSKLLIGLNFALNGVLAAVFILLSFDIRWYNALLLFPAGMLTASCLERIRKFSLSHKVISVIVPLLLFAGSGAVFALCKGAMFANVFKTLAGFFLCIFLGSMSLLVKLESPVMKTAGIYSLYVYIIHLEFIKMFGLFDDPEPSLAVTGSWTVLAATTLCVMILSFLIPKFFRGKEARR